MGLGLRENHLPSNVYVLSENRYELDHLKSKTSAGSCIDQRS